MRKTSNVTESGRSLPSLAGEKHEATITMSITVSISMSVTVTIVIYITISIIIIIITITNYTERVSVICCLISGPRAIIAR